MATHPDYPLLTASEFLQMDFGEHKAELDRGVIRMMAGGTARHSRVQSNIVVSLGSKLRESGCAPYGPAMAVRTSDTSIRYPDVSVYCGRETPEHDADKSASDPRCIFEVLSAGTARTDLRVKLDEYKALPSVDTIIFVDIATERLRIVQRTGRSAWNDVEHDGPTAAALPSLGIALSHDDIFTRA